MQQFLRILCNPVIFRILVCSEPEEYSEPCQVSMMYRGIGSRFHPIIFVVGLNQEN